MATIRKKKETADATAEQGSEKGLNDQPDNAVKVVPDDNSRGQAKFRIRTSRSPSPNRAGSPPPSENRSRSNTKKKRQEAVESAQVESKPADAVPIPDNLVRSMRNAHRSSKIAARLSMSKGLNSIVSLESTNTITSNQEDAKKKQVLPLTVQVKIVPLEKEDQKKLNLQQLTSPTQPSSTTKSAARSLSPKKKLNPIKLPSKAAVMKQSSNNSPFVTQAKQSQENQNKDENDGNLDIGSSDSLPPPPPMNRKTVSRGRDKKGETNKKKEMEKMLLLKKKKKEMQQAQRLKEEERLRLEKIRRQEEEQYLRMERDRLKLEEVSVQELNEYYHERQVSLFRKVRQKESWDITTECNEGRLKLYSKLELDSYRFEIENNLTFETLPTIEMYLTKMHAALLNVNHIENYLFRLQGEENVQEEIDWHAKYHSHLKELLIAKVWDLNIRVMQQADQVQEQKWKELIDAGHDINLLMRSNAFEERQKVEILREYTEFDRIKYVYWINPNGKGGRRLKPVEFSMLHVSIEVPRPFIQSKIIMTGFWMEMDYNQHHLSYTHLYSIGGVYNFQLYEYPTLPKVYQGTILKFKRDNMEDIRQIHYPEKQIDSRARQNFDNFAPIKITYVLPEHIVTPEAFMIGLWDDNLGWQTDQVQDSKFEEETRMVSFTASQLAAFSLVQNRCEDYPYKGWELRSISPESAMLDVITKRFCITFIIRAGFVEMRDINQSAILKRFQSKQYPPYQLLTEMQKCGINILPSANDAMISEILIKDKDCLDLALTDISKAVSGFYIKSCKWNKTVGVNQTLAFIKFNKDYDESFIENIEKDWKLATWYSNKCGFYAARETDKDLTQKYVVKTEARSNFYLAVKQLGKEATQLSERMREGKNFAFWNTVKEFLFLTQLLGYTQ